MSFEEIQNVWAHQLSPAPAAGTAPTTTPLALRQNLQRELSHRRRMLVFYAGVTALSIFLYQLVLIANFINVDQPRTTARFIQAGLSQTLTIVVFLCLLRRIKSVRQLRQQTGQTVRAILTATRNYLRAELSDYRLSLWLAPVVAILPLSSIYINHPISVEGWVPFLQRAAILGAIYLPIVLAAWRHVRQNLAPEYRRVQENLAQLGD